MSRVKIIFKRGSGDFPGRPVIKTLQFHCKGHGSGVAGQGKSKKEKPDNLEEKYEVSWNQGIKNFVMHLLLGLR